MIITTIKLSQEINFNGMPTWIGLEATLLPDENEKDCLRILQKSITEYHQEESVVFGKSTWSKHGTEKSVQIGKPIMSEEEVLIQSINECVSLEGDDGLLSYRIPAASNPSTKSAYDLKMALLKK